MGYMGEITLINDGFTWVPMVTGMILQGGSHLKNIIAFPAKAGLLATFEAGGRSGSSSGSAGKVGGVRGEEEDALAACN